VKSIDQRVSEALGAQMLTILSLQAENEALKAENAALKPPPDPPKEP
jgi:hypothetical protein